MPDKKKNNLTTGNENHAIFKAHIVDTPDYDYEGKYQTTSTRKIVDKRTLQTDQRSYHGYWYPFSGILTLMIFKGQKYDISPDFKINIHISARQDGKPIENLQYNISRIRRYSDIKFVGVPQRVYLSGKYHSINPKDIENADEIYIYPNYINTINVEPPTKETLEKQNQNTQAIAKERLKRKKWILKLGSVSFWRNPIKYIKEKPILKTSSVIFLIISCTYLFLFRVDIIEYVTENPIAVIVNILGSIVGGIILHILRDFFRK